MRTRSERVLLPIMHGIIASLGRGTRWLAPSSAQGFFVLGPSEGKIGNYLRRRLGHGNDALIELGQNVCDRTRFSSCPGGHGNMRKLALGILAIVSVVILVIAAGGYWFMVSFARTSVPNVYVPSQ